MASNYHSGKPTIKPYRTSRKKGFAADLRKRATPSELELKKSLFNTGYVGVVGRWKFQYIILGFIIDFYFPSAKLAVEIDGGYHTTKEQHNKDKQRTDVLNKAGVKVIRFSNDDVLNDMDMVIRFIELRLSERIGATVERCDYR